MVHSKICSAKIHHRPQEHHLVVHMEVVHSTIRTVLVHLALVACIAHIVHMVLIVSVAIIINGSTDDIDAILVDRRITSKLLLANSKQFLINILFNIPPSHTNFFMHEHS